MPLLTPPPEITPDIRVQTRNEFELAVNDHVNWLPKFWHELSPAYQELILIEANVKANASAMANLAWVSGISYTAGMVRYSPLDFLNYRRKTNGAGTTDPKNDPTNWAPQVRTTQGGADTTSSASNITLTSTNGRLQSISMTAAGRKVTLPAATSLEKGVPIFVFKNAGAYRFAIVNNSGVFLGYVDPGQVVSAGCSDTSTAAGVWAISGSNGKLYSDNSQETVNAVVSHFICTAMLTATKAIVAYRNYSTTFIEVVIVNYGSASGTPVVLNAESSESLSITAQTASQATVVYATGSAGNIKGYVLDVSGNTITPGTAQTIHTAANSAYKWAAVSMITTTKLLCSYLAGSNSLKERILDISGTTLTPGAEVTADTSASSTSPYVQIKGISSTKAVITFLSSTGIATRLQSIAGSVPTPTGSVLAITMPGSFVSSQFGFCLLSASRLLIMKSVDRTRGCIVVYLIDVSGTSPILLTSKNLTVDFNAAETHITAAKIDTNRVYMTYTSTYSGGVDSVIITVTNDDRILFENVTENVMPHNLFVPSGAITSSFPDCEPLDSSHVLQLARNSAGNITSKVIEIAA